MDDTTITKLKNVISEQLNVPIEQVTSEASFMKNLGADSLDIVELVMALEEEFDIEIADEAASEITSVQNAIDYIDQRL